jgi:hypothetical protein
MAQCMAVYALCTVIVLLKRGSDQEDKQNECYWHMLLAAAAAIENLI